MLRFILTLCFIGWSHDMMPNVPGKSPSSGTKLIQGPGGSSAARAKVILFGAVSVNWVSGSTGPLYANQAANIYV